ncbi:MAG: hypothetical protein QW837_06515 [Conexivisphaerales archaeon]
MTKIRRSALGNGTSGSGNSVSITGLAVGSHFIVGWIIPLGMTILDDKHYKSGDDKQK